MNTTHLADKAKLIFTNFSWLFWIVLAIAGALIVQFILLYLFQRLQSHFTYTQSKWKHSFTRTLRKPCILLVWVLAVSYILEAILSHFSMLNAQEIVGNIRTIAFILMASWFLLSWHKDVQSHLLKTIDASHPYEKAKLHIFGRMITLAISVMGLGLALHVMGVGMQTILTLGGMGGLALGIAGRDVFANIFSGVMIYITQPFILGDWVRSHERQIEGIVEEIGWYYTCIRAFNKQPIYVPNSVFSTIVIVNSSRMTHWRIDETIGIRYKNFSALRDLIQEIQNMLNKHPDLDPNQDHTVFFDRFDVSSLNIKVAAYTLTSKERLIGQIKQDILLRTGEIMAKHGLDFAFPTTTLDFADTMKVKLQD